MEDKYLYIIFSSTPYKIGRFIRKITGAQYNHISVSLDADLGRMYGFARRYYRTPFYGGFVLETPARYCVNGVSAQIKVFRIPVSTADHRIISDRLARMYKCKEQYLYNHFSAWVFPLHCRIPAKDAYVCVEFCVQVLQEAGIEVDAKKFYSVDDLERLLEPYTFHMGTMPQNGITDEVFFSKKPLPHPIFSSLRSMAALIPRIGRQ